MPELPEVETLRRQLSALLPGRTIETVEVFDLRLGTFPELAGRTVRSVERSGKWLHLRLSGELTAILHLRMSGRLLWQPGEEDLPAYARLRLGLSGGGRLVLIDPRRFATLTVGEGTSPSALAPDPLIGLSGRRLATLARGRRLPVKAFLMDPRLVPGIGNIYAAEILHHAGILPARPAGDLSAAEWRAVTRAIATVLPRAVECRGTTLSDWRDLHGRPGSNQEHLEVYGRQGEPCRRCGTPIRRTVQGGRGTWFCPGCQC